MGWRLWLAVVWSCYGMVVWGGEYPMPAPGDDLVGQSYTIVVKQGDSLTSIRNEHGISYDELLVANPKIDFYNLKIGQEIFIPKQFILPRFREGIVINIPELRLYYFTPDGQKVYTFTVGLGREDWRTPVVATKVVSKKEDPVWTVPKRIHDYVYQKTGKVLPARVGPGPDNPLGAHALYLGVSGYLIHGTNAPTSVGTFISSGCVRLWRKPLEILYQNVQVGTPVHIIHHPVKVGWLNGSLYLEVHRPINSYLTKPESELNVVEVDEVIYDAVRHRPAKIDWRLVHQGLRECNGVPGVVGQLTAN